MLWIPVGLVLAKLIYDVATSDDEPAASAAPEPTTLERNLRRLRAELAQCTGQRRVAILGQPGAGKSSLLRALSNQEVRPLPMVGQQTDATNWAESTQVPLLSHWRDHVFADVPGYDTASHPVSVYEAEFPVDRFEVLVLVLSNKLHQADQRMYGRMRCEPRMWQTQFPVAVQSRRLVIVRSFAESLDADERTRAEVDIRRHLNAPAEHPVIFVSSRSGEGLPALCNALRQED